MATTEAGNVAPETPKIIKLAGGIYARQEIDNMGWADLGGQGIVIDALEKRAAGDEVIAAIEETLPGVTISSVLNTHTHFDHIALNKRFHSHFGAAIINAKNTDIPVDGLGLEGSERTCLMMPLPDCHTPEDCIIWFPAERVLFVGDLFGWGLVPCNGNLRPHLRERIIAVYERLIALEADVVVPGHGPLCTNSELKRWLAYFHWLYETVEKCREEGLTFKAVSGTVMPPADMTSWWRFVEWKHADSLKKVFKDVKRKKGER